MIKKKLSLLGLVLITGLLVVNLVAPLWAAEAKDKDKEKEKPKTQAEEDYLTKGEAVVLISATDFMKQRIGDLLSWTIGYDISRVNRARLVPVINYVLAVPKAAPPDGRTIIEIKAAVDDPSGLKNISGVRADLTGIGKLPNMMLVDNGLWGDEKANDGIYTLQTNISPKVEVGGKEIAVAVSNKKGWLTMAKTSMVVEKNPKIVKITALPEKVPQGKAAVVLLTVKVLNPGRVEDIKSVTVDLSAVGGERAAAASYNAVDDTFNLKITVPAAVESGPKKLPVRVNNVLGGVADGEININISGE